MGLGAALVDGDKVLHGISGVPLLAANRLSFMLFVFATTWVGLKLGWHGKVASPGCAPGAAAWP